MSNSPSSPSTIIPQTVTLLESLEGNVPVIYDDSLGIPTIGVGHALLTRTSTGYRALSDANVAAALVAAGVPLSSIYADDPQVAYTQSFSDLMTDLSERAKLLTQNNGNASATPDVQFDTEFFHVSGGTATIYGQTINGVPGIISSIPGSILDDSGRQTFSLKDLSQFTIFSGTSAGVLSLLSTDLTSSYSALAQRFGANFNSLTDGVKSVLLDLQFGSPSLITTSTQLFIALNSSTPNYLKGLR